MGRRWPQIVTGRQQSERLCCETPSLLGAVRIVRLKNWWNWHWKWSCVGILWDGRDGGAGVRTFLLVSCLDGICFAWPMCPLQSKLLQLLFSRFGSRHLAYLGFVKSAHGEGYLYHCIHDLIGFQPPKRLSTFSCEIELISTQGVPINTWTWIPTRKKHLCSRPI